MQVNSLENSIGERMGDILLAAENPLARLQAPPLEQNASYWGMAEGCYPLRHTH